MGDADHEVAVVEQGGHVRIYHRDSTRPSYTLSSGLVPLTDADWSAANSSRVAGYADGHLILWDQGFSRLPAATHELGTGIGGIVRCS
jgi:hypothetical protein